MDPVKNNMKFVKWCVLSNLPLTVAMPLKKNPPKLDFSLFYFYRQSQLFKPNSGEC